MNTVPVVEIEQDGQSPQLLHQQVLIEFLPRSLQIGPLRCIDHEDEPFGEVHEGADGCPFGLLRADIRDGDALVAVGYDLRVVADSGHGVDELGVVGEFEEDDCLARLGQPPDHYLDLVRSLRTHTAAHLLRQSCLKYITSQHNPPTYISP